MHQRVSVERLRVLSRFAAILTIGSLAAGCSSDVLRFSGDPFSNPFASKGQATGSRFASGAPAAPRDPIYAEPLPEQRAPVYAEPLPPPEPQAQPQRYASRPAYNPTYALPKPIASPASVSSRALPIPTQSGAGGWSARGGTPVEVGPGDTLNVIANRYGVPASAILSANGLKSAAQIAPGRQVIIPVYNAGGVQTAAVQSMPRAGKAQAESARLPRPVDTMAGPRGRSGQFAEAQPGRLQTGPAAAQTMRLGEFARAELPPIQQPKPQYAETAAPARRETAQPAQAKEIDQTASLPSGSLGATDFRWPVRGRVISGFGGGSGNEGINIAVPEGTPVKAAEAGTVAYAGNEVKGYGNLVLIRHDNGYVSAYAHNDEIVVKRNDKVRRGQVIARSGQTGNVTSPQLHFEIRKGSTPVDPIPHLSN